MNELREPSPPLWAAFCDSLADGLQVGFAACVVVLVVFFAAIAFRAGDAVGRLSVERAILETAEKDNLSAEKIDYYRDMMLR